ncbi:embryogenesis-associated protein EMB8 [Ricinus communis]|uniref:Alpha/beta hydrolase domain containing protein 1,3, putative n=1 Tax=Ricinus communis TaxID=3988 RepID=B9T6L2_RICCO|nr:embryogenesis-associated protein EMB8 [Ricinus communis]EEF28499.1 alpha/beta hydrolase domain containing protein 1,3, putative [Ricinus communis]|eukprot:XP_002533881.1 embryogenesis-associated protein EMB8 [Ricinus communis]
MEDCTLNSLVSPYNLLFKALSLIPITHYLLFFLFTLLIFLYYFLEIHFFHNLLTFFRGDPVLLTCNFSSELYQSVASKCKILHGRFSPTPWLSSPHLQTAFLSFFGDSPNFVYKRHLFQASDGGTLALDWLMYSDIAEQGVSCKNDAGLQDDKAPIVVVVPGLTSDSAAAYIKHLAFTMARQGWNVVVSNHRGLGGISLTSDCFYNAGWTEDLRSIIDHIHCQYPEAPLYAVGTSIGANILVKYLGEHGVDIPLTGAAAVCSPWDLLICDRFINRRCVQKFYDRKLAVGLQDYAQLHHSILSRLIDWENIKLSRSVRDFDKHATRILAKCETVDTYYRRSSCVNVVGNVSVPLICVSALDDPVCTREAIPWDECRANENIILVTTKHGGHLAYYEGITAKSMWWVRAVDEFLHVLHSSPLKNRRKKVEGSNLSMLFESSVDQGPYVNVMEDGLVTTIGNTLDNEAEETSHENEDDVKKGEEHIPETEKSDHKTVKTHSSIDLKQPSDQNQNDLITPVKRYTSQLARHSRISVWLLAYIAIATTWPLVGSALLLFIKRKFRNINFPAALLRR